MHAARADPSRYDDCRYAQSAMLFSDMGVDPGLISWNRVVLLHGPPGAPAALGPNCRSCSHPLPTMQVACPCWSR